MLYGAFRGNSDMMVGGGDSLALQELGVVPMTERRLLVVLGKSGRLGALRPHFVPPVTGDDWFNVFGA
jgi:hypothetical protein